MLYMLGSPQVQLIAVLISGACELVQRSSIVVFDELLRERLFRAPMDAATRARQIQIWTQVCWEEMRAQHAGLGEESL